MAGAVKIQKFLGEAPKVSSELLPDTFAQTAVNVKLYSGDLLPYNQSASVASMAVANAMTIYPMSRPSADTVWLQWATDVDVVKSSETGDTSQRIYYTGDGEPRVTNYNLATTTDTVVNNTPQAYYTLGLPLPNASLVATPVSFTTLNTTYKTRDNGNIATIEVASTETLLTGMYVTISGFTGTASELAFNQTNVQITVISSTAFTYYNYGDAFSRAADTNGRVGIGGNLISRTYLHTWYTAWGEESMPSEPSTVVYLKEGQQTNITGLPTSWPGSYSGTYNQTGMRMRLYRTVVSSSATKYYMVTDVPMIGKVSKRERVTNVATLTTDDAHGLSVGSVIVVAGMSSAGYNGTVTITAVTEKTFSYANVAANETPSVTESSGTFTISTYKDSTDIKSLATVLPSEEWDQPNEDMVGLLAIHNKMLVGFFDNTVCFSEPGFPHAWPISYRKQVDSKIVAVGNVGATVIVLTESNPWIIQGNSPKALSQIRMDYVLPCASKRSVVNMGYGLCFASLGGIAVYSLMGGGQELTQHVYDWDNFRTTVLPTTVAAEFYNGKYFAVHSLGQFVFERDEKVGGHLVELGQPMTALYYDKISAMLYYAYNGAVWRWDDVSQPLTQFTWKSKTLVTKDYMNLGAARVVADYEDSSGDVAIAAQNVLIIADNAALVAAKETAGAIAQKGPTSGTYPRLGASIGQVTFGGSRIKPTIPLSSGLYFSLYVEKTLIYTAQIASSEIFRLPTGYRSDTFEVGLIGNVRVRAVHLGENPISLKQV